MTRSLQSQPGKQSVEGEPGRGVEEDPRSHDGVRSRAPRRRPPPARRGRQATHKTRARDGLVATSANGPLLHPRRFLSYHGDRFRDRSLMVTSTSGKLIGVFPAAEDPADPSVVTSHPGLTYSGIVHDGRLHGALMVRALRDIAEEYRALGFTRLRYKAVPPIYQSSP